MGETQESFWKHKLVFVTGASGFLGSWFVEELIAQGAHVVALVRDIHATALQPAPGPGQHTVVLGRLEDHAGLLRAINEYEIDTVFHLGAQAIVGTANRNPLSTFESNIRGTWNLLEACRLAGTVKRIVVASSDKAYGSQESLPYDESMSLRGRHPYDVSKSCTDLIAQTYHETYNLPVCITRCGNFFGGRDTNFNRIVPDVIRSAYFDSAPVLRSDGSFIRDYIYVRDVVAAYLTLAEHMDDASLLGQAFNFSLENQITVLELTKKILGLMEKNHLEPVILNQVHDEIKDQYLSAKKARELLGWTPKYSLDEALLETIQWYGEFFEKQDREVWSEFASQSGAP